MDGDDARVATSIFVDNLRASVGRAVIDENNFNITEVLAKNAIDALAKIFFDFVNRDDNGYFNHEVIITRNEKIGGTTLFTGAKRCGTMMEI